MAGNGGGSAPSISNVKPGTQVTLISSKAEFEAAFHGKGYTWHPAMDKLLGKTVTVNYAAGGIFGLPKSDPNHYQTVWYYPLSVIACVGGKSAPEEPTTTTTPCKFASLCEILMVNAPAKKAIPNQTKPLTLTPTP